MNRKNIKKRKIVEDILEINKKRNRNNYGYKVILSPYKITQTLLRSVLGEKILLSSSTYNKYEVSRNKPFVFFNTNLTSFKYGVTNNYHSSMFISYIEIVSFDSVYIIVL
jgi:hypothetical protein